MQNLIEQNWLEIALINNLVRSIVVLILCFTNTSLISAGTAFFYLLFLISALISSYDEAQSNLPSRRQWFKLLQTTFLSQSDYSLSQLLCQQLYSAWISHCIAHFTSSFGFHRAHRITHNTIQRNKDSTMLSSSQHLTSTFLKLNRILSLTDKRKRLKS